MWRLAIITCLEAEPTLQHLSWFAAVVLAPSTGLETGDEQWGEQGEGETQGDPKAPALMQGEGLTHIQRVAIDETTSVFAGRLPRVLIDCAGRLPTLANIAGSDILPAATVDSGGHRTKAKLRQLTGRKNY